MKDWTQIPAGDINSVNQRIWSAIGDQADTVVDRIKKNPRTAIQIARLMIGGSDYLRSTFFMEVSYDRSIDDLLKAGCYKYGNRDIKDCYLPTEECGQSTVEFGLFHFNKRLLSEQVITEMNIEGFRPASTKELLTMGEKRPSEQVQHTVIALGSPLTFANGIWKPTTKVVGLYCDRFERRVGLSLIDTEWSGDIWFLGVSGMKGLI